MEVITIFENEAWILVYDYLIPILIRNDSCEI